MKLGKFIGAAAVTLSLAAGISLTASAADFYFGQARPYSNGNIDYDNTIQVIDTESTDAFAVPVCIELDESEKDIAVGGISMTIDYKNSQLTPSGANPMKMSYTYEQAGATILSPVVDEENSTITFDLVTASGGINISENELAYVLFTSNAEKNTKIDGNSLGLTISGIIDTNYGEMTGSLNSEKNTFYLVPGKSTDISFKISANPTATEALKDVNAVVKNVWAKFSPAIAGETKATAKDDRTVQYVKLTECTVDENGSAKFDFTVENSLLGDLSSGTNIDIYVELDEDLNGKSTETVAGAEGNLYKIEAGDISDITVTDENGANISRTALSDFTF